MKILPLLSCVLLLGAGCTSVSMTVLPQVESDTSVASEVSPAETGVVLPVSEYNASYKRYGEYFQDRFTGYHVADDIEFSLVDMVMHDIQEIPVFAIADGTVRYVDWVGGYGGVIVVAHQIEGETVSALYGHIDQDSVTVKVDDTVSKGQQIAVLGADRSKETDGERIHLHFALWKGSEVKLSGYVSDSYLLSGWMNPYDFFVSHGALEAPNSEHWLTNDAFDYPTRPLDGQLPDRGVFTDIAFDVPEGWDVEWIPSEEALNLYTLSGTGSARSRSQVRITKTPQGVEASVVNVDLDPAVFARVRDSLKSTR